VKKKISIVIACYQDSDSIPEVYKRLLKVFSNLQFDYEIIFVNDGSTDNTEEKLIKICENDRKVIAIFHSRNFGLDNAFSSGMKYSTGDAIVLLDGDMQDPPEMIPDFIVKWQEGNDVVYGQRVDREGPAIMNFFYKFFYRVFNKISNIKIPLDAGNFALMDKKIVQNINSLKETDRYIRGLRAWVGFKQVGIPYKRLSRKYGVSTHNFLANIRWAKKGIFSFSFFPLEIISYLAYVLFFISVIGIIWHIFYFFFGPPAPRGTYSLIVIILFLGSTNLLFISILSEYISKILEETKNRPNYIIKNILNAEKSKL
jgi:glycosyltransferase involved in cell wall biosynthesis